MSLFAFFKAAVMNCANHARVDSRGFIAMATAASLPLSRSSSFLRSPEMDLELISRILRQGYRHSRRHSRTQVSVINPSPVSDRGGDSGSRKSALAKSANPREANPRGHRASLLGACSQFRSPSCDPAGFERHVVSSVARRRRCVGGGACGESYPGPYSLIENVPSVAVSPSSAPVRFARVFLLLPTRLTSSEL